jgi:DNA-binding NarL/FixJ family response regulator
LRVALDRVLRKNGYGAVLASTLHEAVSGLRRHRGSIRLAIVDLALGEESGMAFVRHMRRRAPELEILVFSAGIDGPIRRELGGLGVREVLTKPSPPETIVAAVRRSLGVGERIG